MATASLSLSPPLLSSIFTPKPCYFSKIYKPSLPFATSLTLPTILHSKRSNFYLFPPQQITHKSTKIWRISAATADVLPSEAPIEETQQLISTDDNGVSTIISVLLFIAFVGLTVVTLGVIYLAVTDFLQKRETKKFQKEEVSKKKKKSGKKGEVKTRTGPRGFGQKIEDDDDFED